VSRDASLTDFAPEEAESRDEDASEEPAPGRSSSAAGSAAGPDPDATTDECSSAEENATVEDTDEPTPAVTTTFAVAGEERSCERCGDVTARRWRDDGAFVCRDCKEW
jgi:hypothetical protein